MTGHSRTRAYPPEGLGAPKDRHPGPVLDPGLPAGTEVFSADDHISLAEDIFYERFPASMKERAPRVMNVGGGWVIGMDGKSILVPEFIEVLTQYDPVSGSHTGDIDARLAALESEGVSRELAFPNSVLALFGWPDREVRELCFRIYNEHMAEIQERSNNRIYGVGLINWWDGEGARRTLRELKALGLKTFLMPLSPGKDLEKRPIDYASTALEGVWDAIEEAQIPVSHHIGESPPATPNQYNAVSIGMLQSVAPFRDTFGKYIFGGILDRHPGLPDRVVRGRDQLGSLGAAGCRAHHGVVPTSRRPEGAARTDVLLGQPHVRLVHGGSPGTGTPPPYRPGSGHVVHRLSPQREHLRVQRPVAGVRRGRGGCGGADSRRRRQHQELPRTGRRMPAGLMASAPPTHVPPEADMARMHRERGERVRALMREQGLDALVLLGNTNVVYATGAIWPLADSGRANFEQPVAVVVVDDEWPHLFSPMRAEDPPRVELPSDHIHGPVYLDFDEGVEQFASQLAAIVPDQAVIAMDEWTNALRRERQVLFAPDPPVDGGRIISRAKAQKTPDELSCMREGLRITEQAIAAVQAQVAPGVRQTDLSATFLRTIFDAGADANILDPIWQVMPARMADGPWTTTGDLACPLLSTERELVEGDVLWVDTGISYAGFHSDFGRTWIVGREPDARQRAQFERWRAIWMPSSM